MRIAGCIGKNTAGIIAVAIDKDANCEASDAIGDLVFVTGPEVAGRIQVAKIDIDDGAKMPAIGVIVSKTAAEVCVVRKSGELVLGAIFTPGATVFAGVAGTLTTTPPARPGSGSRLIQRLGVADSATTLTLVPLPDIHEILP